MPLQASLAPKTWFDTSDTDYATVGENSLIQLLPQHEPIEELIKRIAEDYKVSPSLMLRIARCESGLRPSAIGDFNNSFGLWQIHLPSHPQITKEQALNALWSTKWSAEKIANGKAYMWTCFKNMLK